MGTFKLLSGHEIPTVGFGTASLFGNKGKAAVKTALTCGVRQLDCAKVYGNEALVGNALREFLEETPSVSREDIFITSKIWNDDKHPANVLPACRRSLDLLGIDYVDLYLIHWPAQFKKGTFGAKDSSFTLKDTWRAMEALVENGLVKSIGVSNFGVKLIEELCAFAKVMPVVNQIEVHPQLQQERLVKYCKSKGILVTAWSPLAKFKKEVIHSPIIEQVAKKYDATNVQVVLAWHLARGIAIIPRSGSPPHIRSNLHAGDLAVKLTEEDMAAMATLNKDKRLQGDFVGAFEETAFVPWHIFGYIVDFLGTLLWMVFPNKLDVPYTFFRLGNPSMLKPPNRKIDAPSKDGET